jgi:hypothetical protein
MGLISFGYPIYLRTFHVIQHHDHFFLKNKDYFYHSISCKFSKVWASIWNTSCQQSSFHCFSSLSNWILRTINLSLIYTLIKEDLCYHTTGGIHQLSSHHENLLKEVLHGPTNLRPLECSLEEIIYAQHFKSS